MALLATQHRAIHFDANEAHYSYDDARRHQSMYYDTLQFVDYIACYSYDVVTVVIVLCCYPSRFVILVIVEKIICILQLAHTNQLSMIYCI